MRKSSAIVSRAAVAAGVLLSTWLPARAADMFTVGSVGSIDTMPAGMGGDADLRDVAIGLRAAWLARGHSVQQLGAISAPVITGGTVNASTITIGNAGEFPSVQISYATGAPGLYAIEVTFVSPNGKTSYSGGYGTFYYTKRGTEKFAIAAPLSLYASPGKWSIASATIIDNAGTMTTYDASQLQPLFKNLSFTVINTGLVAKAPPKIISGKLLNTTVSLSAQVPFLKATITANDRREPGIYQAYVTISPPGNPYAFYSILPNALPVKAGRIKANNVINPGSPTGTWSIVGFGVCDYAFNCSSSTDDSAIVALFGTDTFTVTP
jgi:hypothetical protein